jgi:hypothetical protein
MFDSNQDLDVHPPRPEHTDLDLETSTWAALEMGIDVTESRVEQLASCPWVPSAPPKPYASEKLST